LPSAPDDTGLRALVAHVGAFHITDRAMKRAQERIETALVAGALDDELRRSYTAAVRQYFEGFAREARAHLRDLDRRLEQLHQVQFNLTAERGVAVKRIESTAGILHELAALEETPA